VLGRFLFLACALGLAACNLPQDDASRTYSGKLGPETNLLVMTAAGRMVVERPNPLPADPTTEHRGPSIICTEPPPDVANALATLLAAQLSGKGPGGATGTGGLTSSSSEAVAELGGRSTALLGLRDGLFKACEAYANGIIGDDAYTLLLTRYGQLMVTLFLGQDVSSAAAQQAKAAAPPPVTESSNSGNNNGAASGAGGPKGGGGGAGAEGGAFNARAVVHPASPLSQNVSFIGSGRPPAPVPVAGDPSAADQAAPAPAGAALSGTVTLTLPSGTSTNIVKLSQVPAGTAPDAQPENGQGVIIVNQGGKYYQQEFPLKTLAARQPSTTTTKTSTSVGMSPAEALSNMQQAYFNLGKDSFSTLLVACINEFDQTRPSIHQGHWNIWLRTVCDQVAAIKSLSLLDVAQVVTGLSGADRQKLINSLPNKPVLPPGYVFPYGQQQTPPLPGGLTCNPAMR
jgi:hypothetical protein